jgi:hypothetical protein
MHRTARCTRAYASRFDFPRARAWSFVTTNSRKLASKFFRAGSERVDDVEVEGRDDARVTASSTTVRSASSSTTSPTASSIATTPWRAGECKLLLTHHALLFSVDEYESRTYSTRNIDRLFTHTGKDWSHFAAIGHRANRSSVY